jgi:magnesium-transporting ATPase (P-type)
MSAAHGLIGLGCLGKALEFSFDMAGVDRVATLYSPIGLGTKKSRRQIIVSPNAETAKQKSVPEGKSKSDAKAQAKVDLKPGAKPESKDDLKSLAMPDLEKKLGSSPDGLSQDEAKKRLTQYGPNEIPEKKANPFLKFLGYFGDLFLG